MSMLSKQVKELREMSIRQRNNAKVSGKVFFEIENALSEAADTIEALSAKLQAANMENGGGWIACKDRLPKDDTCVLAQVSGKHKNITFENAYEFATYINGEGWILETYPDWNNPSILAWQPLPEPYHP